MTSYTKDNSLNKTGNQQQIKFLNPRSLNNDTIGSAFKEFKSAAKPGNSPLRFR